MWVVGKLCDPVNRYHSGRFSDESDSVYGVIQKSCLLTLFTTGPKMNLQLHYKPKAFKHELLLLVQLGQG